MKKKHYLLIAALSLSLTTAACATTLSACKDDDTEHIQIIKSLTGTYYFDDNGTERTLKLGLTSFSLDFGDGIKTGYYSSYDNNGTITFDFDNSETATAVFKSDVLTMQYNGRTYVLYRQKDLTVKFDVDGGSAVADQTVVNGKKAVRPATNPTRPDSAFIGWYKESACVTPFDFDTEIITSNTTIYAKFITINAEFGVYRATFDLGEGIDENYPAVETVNRVLYNLPELPSKDGNDFLGWWVSDYYDGEKLSCRYNGQEIYEDTVLYAVWASDKAAVSVTPDGANWSARGTNKVFEVCIKDADGHEWKRQNNAATSIEFNFDAADAGDYTVEVTVGGNTTVAYYRNKALARVAKFAVEDDYLGFLPIETKNPAVSVNYYLDFECGTAGHKHEHVALAGHGFDFSACKMLETGIKFRVTAEANGYAKSVSEEFTVLRGLEKATGLEVNAEKDLLIWDAVENAKSYLLKFTDGGTTIEKTVTTTSFDMRSLGAGNWTIELTPYNTTYNTPEATEITYRKARLASPVLSFANDTINWQKVDGATGYRVFVNGVQQGADLDAETTSFAISQNDADYNESYAVTVVALAGDATANSLASDAFYVHDELGEITYAHGKVSWGAVRGVSKFGVKVGDAEEFFVSANETEVAFTKSGATVITVTPYLNETDTATAQTVTVEVYAVTFDTNRGTAVPNQYKADGDTVVLPENDPTRTGYTFLGWFDSPDGGKHLDANGATEFIFDSTKPTVYAIWKGNEYTVTFNAGEGTLPDGASSEFTVTYGEGEGTYYPVPKIEGSQDRVFEGWYTAENKGAKITDDTGRVLKDWDIPQDFVLFAHWSAPGVKYVNDGSGKGYLAVKDTASINNLTTVTVLESYDGLPVTGISADAFDGCASVTKLRIPSSIKTVIIPEGGPTAAGSSFRGMNGLKEIEVYDVEGEKFFASYEGALYSVKNGGLDELLYVPRAQNTENAVIRVADGTKTIGNYAVASMDLIKRVIIPASVTLIESFAFSSDKSLDTVTFLSADNNQLGDALEIENAVFNSCTALTEITFPKRLAKLDPQAFYRFSSSDKAIKSIFIQELGDTKDKATNYYDMDGVLCKGDELVLFPAARGGNYQTPTGIARIGELAFAYNKELTAVRFLPTITEIGIDAFSGCTALRTVDFDKDARNGDLAIRERAFYGCSAVTNLTLPANLKTLEVNAFGGTNSLGTVTLNCNRGYIEYANDAFATTYGTSYVNILNMGEDVPVFNISGVFGGNLREVNFLGNNDNYSEEGGVVYDAEATEILFFPNEITEFKISDKMTVVKSGVFKGKTTLESIIISKNVRTIEDGAFENCYGLKTIIFEEGGTESLHIGNNAFYGCQVLNMLTLNGRGGAEITIGERAFAAKQGSSSTPYPRQTVAEITLPEGVKSIGKFAFERSEKLETVNLPASLAEIAGFEDNDYYLTGPFQDQNNALKITGILDQNDPEAPPVTSVSIFNGASSLKNVNVATGNAYYESKDGVLYGKTDGNIATLLYVPRQSEAGLMPDEYKQEEGERGYIAVPESVTKVAGFALAYAGNIKRIEFLGAQTSFTLEQNAFLYASGLEALAIPSGITEINQGLFNGCTSLKEVEIPNTVEWIRKSAFAGCSTLETVRFAPGNDSLELKIEDGEWKTSSESGGGQSLESTGAFFGCTALETIELPARLTYIGKHAFRMGYAAYQQGIQYNSNLRTVKIPVTVKTISEYAFYQCRQLTSLTFTGTVTKETDNMEIGQYAFYNCPIGTGENGFALPENLVSLGNYALQGSGLTELTIPAKLETLGTLNITTLETLHFATMEKDGKQVNSLTALPLLSMASLTSVELENCTQITSIPSSAFKGTAIAGIKIPAQVTSIGSTAFENCKNLTEVTFLTDESGKSNVETINSFAFRNSGLTDFVFPTLADGKALTLGESLFEGCVNLTDMTISASVQDIGNALSKVPNLENVTVDDGAGVIIDAANRLLLGVVSEANKTYKINSAFSAIPLDANGKFTVPGTYTNPNTQATGTIVEIGDGAFTGQNAVRVFVIPESIVSIGKSAFSQCRGLETLEFTGTSTLASIGEKAFEHTYSFESLTLPKSVTSLGASCFLRSSINEVTLPDRLDVAGKNIFEACTRLERVNNFPVLSDAALKTAENFFYQCRSLRSVSFAEGVTKLPKAMFADCTSLETVDLTGITEIVDGTSTSYTMFKGCTALREVTLDAKLTTLPALMFYNCAALTTVYRSDLLAEDAGKAEADTYRYKNNGKVDLSQVTKLNGTTSYGMFQLSTSITEVDLSNIATISCAKVFNGCSALKKVTLSASRLSNLNYMFTNCTSLKTVNYMKDNEIVGNDGEVTFNTNIDFLGTYTFQNSGVEAVNVPDSVKVLGTSATAAATSSSVYLFDGCTKLKKVVLPAGLTKIGGYVFRGCEVLDTIQVRNTDGSITGENGKITLPKGFELLGNYAFMNCKKIGNIDLSTISVYANLGTSGSYNSGLFYGCESLSEVKLNDNLEMLGSGMFNTCPSLKEITLPAKLKATGTFTFAHSGLTSIELPDGVAHLGVTSPTGTIASNKLNTSCSVFLDCADLETVTVSENLTALGADAFKDCINLTSISLKGDSEGAKTWQPTIIGNSAFKNCAKLEALDLSKVEAFPTTNSNSAITGCASLRELDLSSLTSALYANMFDGFTNLEKVIFGDHVTAIPNYMFRDCTSLREIDLKNVEKIGDYAFYGCTKLSTVYTANTAEGNRIADTVDLSGITLIGTRAFQDCKAFVSVTLDDALEATGDTAFYGCSSLTTVHLPKNLETISFQSFLSCSSLAALEIPASVTSIGSNVFVGCRNLVLSVAAGNGKYEIRDRWLVDKTTNTVLFMPATTDGVEPENITEFNFADGMKLYPYMFNGYGAVTKITLPNDLTEIPNYAFWNFAGSFGAGFGIPSGVTSIGNGAFQNSEITEIVIPEGVTSLGANAFQGCTELTKITLPSTLTSIGNYAFDGCAKLATIVLPASLPESGLKIGDYAFRNCSSLNGAIALPAGITSIGTRAFEGCSGISEISFGEGLATVGSYSFKGCDALTKVRFGKGLTEIKDYVFTGLKNLQSVNIPYTAKKFGNGTFAGCTALSTVTFDQTPAGETPEILTWGSGSGTTTISSSTTTPYPYTDKFGVHYHGTFAGCTALKSLEIPEGRMNALPTYAFIGSGLESFTIPASMTTINSYAFNYTKLKSITIPHTVISLGIAFGGCDELASVVFEETPEGVDKADLKVTGGSVSKVDTKGAGYSYYNKEDRMYYSGLFVGLPKLTEVTLPSRMTGTPTYMFAFSSLQKINLGGLAKVGTNWFKGCEQLTDVVMPEGTTEIGTSAFIGCTNLANINIASTVTAILGNAFEGCTSIRELVVPVTTSVRAGVFMGWTADQTVSIDIAGSEFYSGGTTTVWYADALNGSEAQVRITGVSYSAAEAKEGE